MKVVENKFPFRCVLCEGVKFGSIVSEGVVGDDLGRHVVVECASCHHVQQSPSTYDISFYLSDGQVDNVLNRFKVEKEKLFEIALIEAKRRVVRLCDLDQSLFREQSYKRFKSIDIGGGYGFFSSAFLNRYPGSLAAVLEPSQLRVDQGVEVIASLDDASWPQPVFYTRGLDNDFVLDFKGKFNLVTAWHVLEHLPDPIDFIRKCSMLVAKGGVLCIEVPNYFDDLLTISSAYRDRFFMAEHISYFSPTTLSFAINKAIPGSDVDMYGCQRYGIFNYVHWIQNNRAMEGDPDYFPGMDRFHFESVWRQTKERALTADALFCVVHVDW